jgi:two-component system sensor histidine kinase KdpD
MRLVPGCLAGILALAIVTGMGLAVHINLTSVSFLYLLLVFGVALYCGFWEASLIALIAVIALDYYFIPPVFHLDVANPQDWVSLGVFEIAALVIGRLSTREARSTREAAIHRTEMERLYELSRNFLLLDFHQPPGPQLSLLMRRIFNLDFVALYDAHLERHVFAGDQIEGLENIARRYFLQESPDEIAASHTAQRILRHGDAAVGALVVRGAASPVVVDGIAALAAIAVDRYRSFANEERAHAASRTEQLRTAVMDALAHDLKTPLSTVQMANSGLCEVGTLNEAQQNLAAVIEGETSRLNDLCTRMLSTARLDADSVGLHLEDVPLRTIVSQVVQRASGVLAGHPVDISVDYGIAVRADSALLTMMIAQYIENAAKYSDVGTPIRIAAQVSMNEALISVHNFGPAIRPEDRERIFERFYRAPRRGAAIPGTGIGLSLVRKAAEAHHGHVWAVSDALEGTTFYLSIPAVAEKEVH